MESSWPTSAACEAALAAPLPPPTQLCRPRQPSPSPTSPLLRAETLLRVAAVVAAVGPQALHWLESDTDRRSDRGGPSDLTVRLKRKKAGLTALRSLPSRTAASRSRCNRSLRARCHQPLPQSHCCIVAAAAQRLLWRPGKYTMIEVFGNVVHCYCLPRSSRQEQQEQRQQRRRGLLLLLHHQDAHRGRRMGEGWTERRRAAQATPCT